MGSLNRFINTAYGTSATASAAHSFENLNNLKIRGTKTGLDGQSIPLSFFNTVVGQAIKLNYAFPSQLAVSKDLFSNTLTKFDTTNLTFDDSTP
jgi:hypothetical protein